jgi:hypothetical protein
LLPNGRRSWSSSAETGIGEVDANDLADDGEAGAEEQQGKPTIERFYRN